jgi:zinc/manganese transport system substrate-binding protein
MRRFIAATCAIAAACARLACAGLMILALVPSAGAADKLKVVATFSVIADMVTNIARDRVDLIVIVGPGGDTELYQPTAADAKSVAEAKVLFMNGLNDEFEPWIEPLIKKAGFKGTKIVVSRGAKTITAEEQHTADGKEKAAAIDQHAWLDPANGAIYVKNIAEALARADTANAAAYREAAAGYTKEIQATGEWAKAEMKQVPPGKRRIITSHDSLEYLAKALGFTLISIHGWTNNKEPSAAQLSALAKQVKQERVKALFLDSITDPRATERIAQETGVDIGGTLYGDALSKPGGEASSYVKMLRHNVATLKAGMLKN